MKLTRRDLENAYHIAYEIKDIERQIETLLKNSSGIVGDTVRDYRTGKGIPIVITGYAEKEYKRLQKLISKLQSKKARLIKEKSRIEEEIEHIEEADIRRIIRLRYFECLSWDAVANAVDNTKTGDAMRKRLYKFLSQNEA